jgi:hypothetical protein
LTKYLVVLRRRIISLIVGIATLKYLEFDMSQKKAVHLGTVTPFTRDNQIDVEGIRKNLDFYLRSGVHLIEPASTTREGALLSVEEYEKVARTAVERVEGLAWDACSVYRVERGPARLSLDLEGRIPRLGSHE